MLRNVLEPWHLLIVVIVVMVMFGSKKLPDTARALGKSMRILKSEAKAMKDDGAVMPASSASPVPSAASPASSASTGSAASTVSPVSPGAQAPQAPQPGQS